MPNLRDPRRAPRTLHGLFVNGAAVAWFKDKQIALRAARKARRTYPSSRIDVRTRKTRTFRPAFFNNPSYGYSGFEADLKLLNKLANSLGGRRRYKEYGRDASNPKPGEVYESKMGNRWLVKGRTPKGRVVLQRTTPKFTGDVYWTPSMLARLKEVRGQEAKAVEKALPPDMLNAKFPSGASLFERIMGRKRTSPEYEQTTLPGVRDPNRRYHVYVIETIKRGKRSFYVGQTGKKVEQRFKEHKSGHHFSYAKGAKLLRKDLTRKLPQLYTRQQAERAERLIARTLRKRGLRVIGGH